VWYVCMYKCLLNTYSFCDALVDCLYFNLCFLIFLHYTQLKVIISTIARDSLKIVIYLKLNIFHLNRKIPTVLLIQCLLSCYGRRFCFTLYSIDYDVSVHSVTLATYRAICGSRRKRGLVGNYRPLQALLNTRRE
jgi:hypothetical protein